MRFIQYLTEVFDTKVKLTIEKNSEGFRYFFTIKDNDYSVSFDEDKIGDIIDEVYISFAIKDDENQRGWTTILTDTGNEFKVFSGVISAVDDYLKRRNPNIIEFSASGFSRQNLYNKFAKAFVKKYKNYEKVAGIQGINTKTYRFMRIK